MENFKPFNDSEETAFNMFDDNYYSKTLDKFTVKAVINNKLRIAEIFVLYKNNDLYLTLHDLPKMRIYLDQFYYFLDLKNELDKQLNSVIYLLERLEQKRDLCIDDVYLAFQTMIVI